MPFDTICFRTLSLVLLLLSLLSASSASAGSCIPSSTTLCLDDNRYQVDVDWQSTMASGEGQVFPMTTSTTGFFTFDDPNKVDLLARVVDGCSINGNSWVFLVDLSTLGLTINTADTLSGALQMYNLSLGSVSQPIADTAALACPALRRQGGAAQRGEEAPSAPQAGGGANGLSLIGGRFQVSVQWEDQGGPTGAGMPIPLTDTSGAFWYFSPENPERLINIEPDVETGFYRFASGSPSTVQQTVTVLDTCTGSIQVYDQGAGVLLTIVDPEMHPIFCANQIFVDGFESGDLSSWSSSSP